MQEEPLQGHPDAVVGGGPLARSPSSEGSAGGASRRALREPECSAVESRAIHGSHRLSGLAHSLRRPLPAAPSSEGRTHTLPEFEPICLICGGPSEQDRAATEFLALADPFAVIRCRACGFRWLSPRPTESEYERLYSAAYFSDASVESVESWLEGYAAPPGDYSDRTVRARLVGFRDRLHRLESMVSGRTLLDVGAATGDFVELARGSGWDAEGIELSSFARERAAARGIELRAGSLNDIPEDGSWDVVHLSHVFEHLVDPEGSICRLASAVRPSGLLVIEVPNQFDSIVRRGARLARRGRQRTRTLLSVHHPFFYNEVGS